MSRIRSIDRMRIGLAEAVSSRDLQKARRYIDRLKGIIIDSLIQNDPLAIQLAGKALQESGERLELLDDLPMDYNKVALAWQLRADVATATLAARVRPAQIDTGAFCEVSGDASNLLLTVLRHANAPMSNIELAHRTGKHPAAISRTLKRLEQERLIRRWRGPKGQQLNAPTGREPVSLEQQNRQRRSALPLREPDGPKRQEVHPARRPAEQDKLISFLDNNRARKSELSGMHVR